MSDQRLTAQQEAPLLQEVHREDSVIAVFGSLDHVERAINCSTRTDFPSGRVRWSPARSTVNARFRDMSPQEMWRGVEPGSAVSSDC